ncbi:MAG: AmmeMemoRadiSam system protein B [Bryobacteraceae bacterium]|nr:AmmeMemoRadiSam system protein B [Bryobacteraceae bacterium]
MATQLARIRLGVEAMIAPVDDEYRLVLHDSYHYSPVQVLLPPQAGPVLEFFDGRHDASEARLAMVQATGDLRAGELLDHLTKVLDDAGFLEGEKFEAMRAASEKAFSEAPARLPIHAGGGYPGDAAELKELMQRELIAPPSAGVVPGAAAVAAPHASPWAGYESYRQAYRALGEDAAGRTFVILGTSHYGMPDRFGLTRKPFLTPFGETRTRSDLAVWLAERAPRASLMEDYCHSIEHSIEFQVVYLQALYGPGVEILPVLCGPFGRSLFEGGKPEDDDGVREFFGALGELASREGRRLCFVLGVDMAHMGARYGDQQPYKPHQGAMIEVAERDRARMARLEAGDGDGFWELVRENRDDLKWCGSAPFYTLMKVLPGLKGEVRAYQHWDIDEESVVSFGAMVFK